MDCEIIAEGPSGRDKWPLSHLKTCSSAEFSPRLGAEVRVIPQELLPGSLDVSLNLVALSKIYVSGKPARASSALVKNLGALVESLTCAAKCYHETDKAINPTCEHPTF
jgi:hypothetical protein